MKIASHPVADPAPTVEAMLASGVRLVTFDVFDTLLWRTILFPRDVFLLLGRNPGPSIAAARRLAERVASRFCRTVLGREPTLADVYRILPFQMQQELALEARVSQPNPFCLQLVKALHRRKVPIAAISDMYLSSAQIANLMHAAGYPLFPVYSSASERATKFSGGRLFVKVWERHQVASGETLHVGDNPHADIAVAARLGARTCHVGTPRAALLGLHPSLDRPMKSADESIYWGTLAFRLYANQPDPPHQHTVAGKFATTLAEIVSAADAGTPLALDRAWARLAEALEPRAIERDPPRCSR